MGQFKKNNNQPLVPVNYYTLQTPCLVYWWDDSSKIFTWNPILHNQIEPVSSPLPHSTYLGIVPLDLEQFGVLEYDGAVGLLGAGGGGRPPEGLAVRLGQQVVCLGEKERHSVRFSGADIKSRYKFCMK